MTEFQMDILKLIKSSVTGTHVTISNNFDWDTALEFGKHQHILPMLLDGAYNSGVTIPQNIENKLIYMTSQLIMHSETQLAEVKLITECFIADKIDFVLLKGAELKQLYPKAEYHTMSDVDILIKYNQYDKITEIMKSLGYNEEVQTNHEIVWKKDKIIIELHKRIIPSYNHDYYKYFGDGWKLAEQENDGSSKYVFSKENNFIYLFVHFAKHYRDAGIGILHFVDLYVYLDHYKDLDKEYIIDELTKLKLNIFYTNVIKTIDVCFRDSEQTSITNTIINTIFTSGAYGTLKSTALSSAIRKTKNINETKHFRAIILLKRIFMPYRQMCAKYPVLKKLPVLLPIFWIIRWFSTIIFHRQFISLEIDRIKYADSESVLKYYDDLKKVGLEYNFNE